MKTDGSGNTSWQNNNSPDQLTNLSLSCSVGSSALTITLADAGGSSFSATNPGYITFRNATLTNGTAVERTITSDLTLTISSGSTLGHSSGVAAWIYVYAIDNAGTVELAASTTRHDTGGVISTTAEGGAGAALSPTAIYSTTARSNVACRLIGRLYSTQATAGTWAAVPTTTALWPFSAKKGSWVSRSEATAYRALSDGFFLGHAVSTSGSVNRSSVIKGLTDTNSTPTTIRMATDLNQHVNFDNAAGHSSGFCIPVKAGEYYMATYTELSGTASVTRSYYWIPLE